MKPFMPQDHDRAGPGASGVVEHLPNLAGDQARWAHEAASALAAAMPDLRCSVLPWPGDIEECYHGRQWCFQPGPQWRAPIGASGEALAAALDRAEDWLDEVEAATGLAVEFDRYAPTGNAMAAISITDSGGKSLALLAPLAAPRAHKATAPTIAKLSFVAARLALSEADRIGPGDLIVLESASWQTSIEAEDFAPVAGLRFDPRSGSIVAGLIGNHSIQEPEMSQPAVPREFTVPIMIGLPAVAMDRAKLDALAQGGTLDIGPIAEGLNVVLSIGGRYLASGEIVTIGDRFAVLVAEPSPIAAGEEIQRQASGPFSGENEQEGEG